MAKNVLRRLFKLYIKISDNEWLRKWEHPRTIVIKFPSYEKAQEWYKSEEYKPIKKIRLDNALSNGIIIKGE
jgi:uncharacterized protein (DUF1330 family)